MNYASAREYLLNKPSAREDYPFGPDVMVAKVKGKMFATLSMSDGVANMNLKCDPLHAQELRDLFSSVKAGYHMNKLHWNTVLLDNTIPPGELARMIDHSYGLVVKNLKKTERQQLELSFGPDTLYRN